MIYTYSGYIHLPCIRHVIFCLIQAQTHVETKKPDVTETSNDQGASTEEKEEQNEDGAAAPRRRNARRDS